MTNQILKSNCWYLKLSERHFLIHVSRLPNKQGKKKITLLRHRDASVHQGIINKPSVIG